MRRFRWLVLLLVLLVLGVSVSAAMGAFDGSPRIVHLSPSAISAPTAATPGKGVAAPDVTQAHAFAALRRPQNAVDRNLAGDQAALQTLATAQTDSEINPGLARAVYSAKPDHLFLVPGAGRLCLLAIGGEFGQSTACSSNNHAISDGLGFVYSTNSPSQESPAIIGGVLPDGARNVTIVDNAGNATPVSLTIDGGYWARITHPVKMTWVAADGAAHQMKFPRFGNVPGNVP